jgi:dTDP-4-dehydrorhamnose reductase
MKVLVTGAAGQLGQAMVMRLKDDYDVVGWTRAEIDLTRHRDVRDAIGTLAPAAIVNCASFNQVDKSQDEQATAFEINAMVVATLARAAAGCGAVFVHYSTDFVFSGTATTPYAEVDRPEPRSVYAQSKLVGEWLAADAAQHYVLRVESLFGGPHCRSSIDRIVDAVRSGQTAPVFVDRVVSPSYVPDVVDASLFLLKTRPEHGLYHCVNGGHATWFAVAEEIARRLGKPATVLKPISVNDVSFPAPRPQFAALSNEKLARAGFAMPSWQDAIARYVGLLRPQPSLSGGENGGLTPS